MTSRSLQAFHQGLLLSRRLKGLVEQGAWDEAAALDKERLQMIRMALDLEPRQDVEQKTDLLRQIEQLNREMEAIGREEKRQLSDQLRRLRQGRRADKAYR